MIEVSELMYDPDLAQNFTIIRQIGFWNNEGVWTPPKVPKKIQTTGVIIVTTVRDIEQIPEGDRIRGMMTFYTPADVELYTTQVHSTFQNTSDKIMWQGDLYRIYQVSPYVDYGYWKSIGMRMIGE